MRTPADLKAARLRLGLSHREAAQLIGWPPEGDVSQMERAKSNVCWQGYAEALADHMAIFDRLLDQIDAAELLPDEVPLVAFSNDEDYHQMDEGTAEGLVFASCHRAMLIELQDTAKLVGRDIPIVEFSRDLFRRWREAGGEGSLQAWATHRLTEIERRPGLPPLKLVRRSA